jgi:hypothetical protein
MRHVLLGLVAGLALLAPPVLGASKEEDGKKEEDAKKEVSSLWNIEQMMLQAADNISARYNLNAKQREQTRELMVTEVTRFLDEHPEIWPLVRDLARYQMVGSVPPGEVGKQLGARALPLLEDIRSAILSSNERWRKILSEEQKRMHDYDLQDMEKTFAKMEANFRQMKEGTGGKPYVIPPPNEQINTPPRPPKPDDSVGGLIPPPEAVDSEDYWESYVRKFILSYELDEGQSESALSIMRECREKARAYRLSKQREFAEVEEKLREARREGQAPQAQRAKYRVWTGIQKNLKKPIHDIFQELKDRLDTIPTQAQRERAYAKGIRPERSKTIRPVTGSPGGAEGKAEASPPAATSAPAETAAAATPSSEQPAATPAPKEVPPATPAPAPMEASRTASEAAPPE